MIGKEINGFHIVEKLGQGGMAEVYKAIDLKLEREVAIKFLRANLEEAEVGQKRFELEAKALAKLRHPNIVSVLGYGEHQGQPYLVMDYISGGTLKERMGRPMSWEEAATLLAPIAQALHYAHGKKIVHRDVKPSNILLAEDGRPMLSDFGVAKMLETETSELTGTSVGIGTPHYMSPEQGRNQKIGPRSDIYSLGVVLYEMVTGKKPYEADTPLAVLLKHIEDPIPQPTRLAKHLPEEGERLILKALSKNPDSRFDTMEEMATSLQTGRLESQPRKDNNKPLLFVVAAGVLVGLIALFSSMGGDGDQLGSGLAQASVSEAGGFIVSRGTGYSDLDIAYISADGREAFSLFQIPGKNQVASISPDGEKIAFISDAEGDNDIFIFDMLTGAIKKLVDTPTTEWHPTWSPDGSQLAFVSDFSGSFNLYSINADGSGMRELTSGPLQDWRPSWSPDGTQLVFQRSDNYESANLYILTLASGEIVALTDDPPPVFNGNPAWSPRGDSIVFVSSFNGNHDLFAISPEATGRYVVSASQNNEDLPAWSPDGSKIVFTMDLGENNHELFVIAPDGTGLTRVTNTAAMESDPVWVLGSAIPNAPMTSLSAVAAQSAAQPPTATPRATTPPATSSSDGALVYDDFSQGSAAQPFDPERWALKGEECNVSSGQGYLVFASRPASNLESACTLEPAEFGRSIGRRTEIFEAKLIVEEDFNGVCCTNFGLMVNLEGGKNFPESGGWSECLLSGSPDGLRAVFGIGAQNGDNVFNRERTAEFGKLHSLRYEMNPTTGRLACYLDDVLVGEVVIQSAVTNGFLWISWAGNTTVTYRLDQVGFTP